MRNQSIASFAALLIPFMLLLSYTLAIYSYNFNDEQATVINYVQGKGELGDFTARESEHLSDVRRVMQKVDVLLGLLAVTIAVLGVYLSKKKELGKGLLWGGGIGVLLLFFFVVLSILDFNGLFNAFHHLFFAPGSWIFSSEDKLIQLFPLEFFVNITKRILIIGGLMNLGAIIAGLVVTRYKS